jgi:hypothetical protein
MRRPLIASALAAGLLALGACATLGEPVVLTMTDMEQRCERRGGMLQPTGAQTGRAQTDYVCQEALAGIPMNRSAARSNLNSAIDQGLRNGN